MTASLPDEGEFVLEVTGPSEPVALDVVPEASSGVPMSVSDADSEVADPVGVTGGEVGEPGAELLTLESGTTGTMLELDVSIAAEDKVDVSEIGTTAFELGDEPAALDTTEDMIDEASGALENTPTTLEVGEDSTSTVEVGLSPMAGSEEMTLLEPVSTEPVEPSGGSIEVEIGTAALLVDDPKPESKPTLIPDVAGEVFASVGIDGGGDTSDVGAGMMLERNRPESVGTLETTSLACELPPIGTIGGIGSLVEVEAAGSEREGRVETTDVNPGRGDGTPRSEETLDTGDSTEDATLESGGGLSYDTLLINVSTVGAGEGIPTGGGRAQVQRRQGRRPRK